MNEIKNAIADATEAYQATLSKSPNTVPWNDLAAFLAVARHGGLSAAAREYGSSAPTLGRRMRSLERALGRELFVRKTHGYELTEAGSRFAGDLSEIEARVARLTAPKSGDLLPLVKITAGTWTMLALVRSLHKIAGDPPDIRLRLISEENVLSIARREAAIGFRNTRPTDQGLAGRRLRDIAFAPYAVPDAPDRWILVTADTPSARWVRKHAGDRIACETNTPRLALDLVLKGVGRALLPTFVGEAEPNLERVCPAVDALTHDQWIVTHADDRALPGVRRALDRLTDLFAA